MTRWTLKFLPGSSFDFFPPGNNRKTVIYWNLKMAGAAELLTGDPRWHSFHVIFEPLLGQNDQHCSDMAIKERFNEANMVFILKYMVLRQFGAF